MSEKEKTETTIETGEEIETPGNFNVILNVLTLFSLFYTYVLAMLEYGFSLFQKHE